MGEGMLAGSFARSLFLVHSECAESRYIASRPFRVNAGPVRRRMLVLGWVVVLGVTGSLSESRLARACMRWPQSLRRMRCCLVCAACCWSIRAAQNAIQLANRPLSSASLYAHVASCHHANVFLSLNRT